MEAVSSSERLQLRRSLGGRDFFGDCWVDDFFRFQNGGMSMDWFPGDFLLFFFIIPTG